MNSKSTETIIGASHIRATSAGWYYVRYPVNSFPYLDLVLQDTPFNDPGTEKELRASVYRVDNLSDREQDKAERLEERFRRVELFLGYLEREEKEEQYRWGLSIGKDSMGHRWVPGIRAQHEKHREWIRERIRKNRERFAEDFTVAAPAGSDNGFPQETDDE